MPAPSAHCRAAPGPGCPPPLWRGWTGLYDQVGLGVRNQTYSLCVSYLQEGFYYGYVTFHFYVGALARTLLLMWR